MNKKLVVVGLLAVFMLVAISFSSAVSSNTVKTVEKKESPLFGIRTRRAIGEQLGELKEIIKAKFIGERIFWIPIILKRQGEDLLIRYQLAAKCGSTYDDSPTCDGSSTCKGLFTCSGGGGCTQVPLCGFSLKCTAPS